MPVEFACPSCEGTLRAADGPVGRLVRCAGCMAVLKVPDSPPTDPDDDLPSRYSERREVLPLAAPVAPIAPAPTPARPRSPDALPEEEPEPGGRTVAFWSAVMLVGVGVVAIVCCGLAAVFVPGPDWQQHEFDPQQGGFRAEFPGPPQPDMAKNLRGMPKGATVEGHRLWARGENYAVVWGDAPRTDKQGKARTDQQVLDELLKVLTLDPNIREGGVWTKPTEVGGFPAREFEIRYRNNGTVTGVAVAAGPRGYLVFAGGRFTRPGNPNVRRFIASFEITDPQLLALAQGRADKKKADEKKD